MNSTKEVHTLNPYIQFELASDDVFDQFAENLVLGKTNDTILVDVSLGIDVDVKIP